VRPASWPVGAPQTRSETFEAVPRAIRWRGRVRVPRGLAQTGGQFLLPCHANPLDQKICGWLPPATSISEALMLPSRCALVTI
jgi:hypothetical protein